MDDRKPAPFINVKKKAPPKPRIGRLKRDESYASDRGGGGDCKLSYPPLVAKQSDRTHTTDDETKSLYDNDSCSSVRAGDNNVNVNRGAITSVSECAEGPVSNCGSFSLSLMTSLST